MNQHEILDVLGVGFGPANLAIALTLEEAREAQPDLAVSSLFLEGRDAFAWHPNMLIDGSRIQLSFLKDLVTLRNPRSRFSFLCYLQAKGRLEDFVNMRQFFPTRQEFDDYYRWVADQVSDQVHYSQKVIGVEAQEGSGGQVETLKVITRNGQDGQHGEYLTRNLVLATGGHAVVPEGVVLRQGGRVFHNRDFLARVEEQLPDRNAAYRVLVVGSGQSAAEIFQYLYEHYPNAEVIATLRRYAYKPADESHFVNRIFHPDAVDFLYGLPADVRGSLLDTHADTNYSAVDLDLIREIYEALYARKVVGDNRVKIQSLLELKSVTEDDDRVTAHFKSRVDGTQRDIQADAVILATGFERRQRHALLDSLAPYLELDGSYKYKVDRYYRVACKASFQPHIYLQGFCEDTHGLSDTLLSVLPVRSQEILHSLFGDTTDAFQFESKSHRMLDNVEPQQPTLTATPAS